MAATAQDSDEKQPVAEQSIAERSITAHSTAPGRTVFTESDNRDGWIATDYAVDLRR